MSRRILSLSEFITYTSGSDHALGNFVQVQDIRYASTSKDEQGEGYVLDWDQLSGFTVNLIGATSNDLHDTDRLKKLTNAFIAKESL